MAVLLFVRGVYGDPARLLVRRASGGFPISGQPLRLGEFEHRDRALQLGDRDVLARRVVELRARDELGGVFVGNLITGAIIVETVFAWPGVGGLTYEAVIYRDFPLLQAIIILKSMLILAINLTVDILYAYVDPRIRLA